MESVILICLLTPEVPLAIRRGGVEHENWPKNNLCNCAKGIKTGHGSKW